MNPWISLGMPFPSISWAMITRFWKTACMMNLQKMVRLRGPISSSFLGSNTIEFALVTGLVFIIGVCRCLLFVFCFFCFFFVFLLFFFFWGEGEGGRVVSLKALPLLLLLLHHSLHYGCCFHCIFSFSASCCN